MTNVLRLTLLAVAMSGVLTAPAFAGGGSTKSKPNLTVQNDTQGDVYVVVDPRSDFQNRVVQRIMSGASSDFDDAFTDLGGVILEGGTNDEEVFSVRKGNHTVHAAYVADVQAALAGGGGAAEVGAEFASDTVDVQSDTTFVISGILPTVAVSGR